MEESELREYCHGKLTHYKIPRYILFKSKEFYPYTSSGKVKKNVLAQKCYELLSCGSEQIMAAKA
jgi:fatty-acyl-CoA synthase